MSLGKKLAIIAQLALLNAVWLLNIAVYQKYNCFSEARHLSYIPEKSLLCGSARTADIAGKLFYEYVYNHKVFTTYFPDYRVEGFGKQSPFKMGLDPNDQVSFFIEHSPVANGVVAGIFIDLLDDGDFKAYLAKNKWKPIESEGEAHIYALNTMYYAAYNEDAVVFFAVDKGMDVQQVQAWVQHTYNNASSNHKLRKTLVKHLQTDCDFVISGYSRELIIQSPLLTGFVVTGTFAGDRIKLKTQFSFKNNVEKVFPEHKTNDAYNFDDHSAYFMLQGNFDVENADMIPENLGVVSFNDSLSHLLKRTLHKRSCSKLQLMAYGFKSVNMHTNDDYPEAINLALEKMGLPLPAFIFNMHCLDAVKVDSLLHYISVRDTFLHPAEEGFYRYTFSNYDLFLRARESFTVQTSRDMHQTQFPETGYSNFVYIDYNKLRESIPNLAARTLATDYDFIKHILVYSTSCKGNVLYGEGEVVIETGKPSLLEVMVMDKKVYKWKDLQEMMFRQAAPPEE